MAVRLGGTYPDLNDTQWTINVHDSEYSGGIVPVDVQTAKIDYQGSRDSHAPIRSSAATISFLIDGATLNSFVTDCIGAEEKRFRLEIRKGADLFWVGLILTDDITKQDKEWPYRFTVRATDGLATLQTVDYNNAGTAYSGKERCTEHIINCLNKIGTSDLFATPLLSTAVKWFSTEHTSTNVDPFHESRFDHRRWINIDSSGVQSFASCYDVIKQICEAWAATIILTEGTYKIIQINEYEGATFDLFNYTTAKAATTATTSATYRKTDATDAIRLDGGSYKYLPALNEVVVKYKHFQAQSIIPGDGIGFNDVDYDDVDSGSGTARLLLNFQASVRASFNVVADFEPLRLLYKIKVKVGSNYLRREATINGSAFSYSAMTWESSESFFEVLTPVLVNNNISQVFNVNVLTPAIPADGTLTLNGRYGNEAYTASGNTISPSTVEDAIFNAYLEVIVAGAIEDRSNQFTYSVENDTTGNTVKKELEVPIGDGPSVNALGALQVFDGSGWFPSNGWKVNATDGTDEIGQVLAQELLYTRSKPAEIINATYKGDYTPLYSIYLNNKDHVPITCTVDLIEGKTNGQFVRIDSQGAALVDKTKQAPFEPDGTPLSPITPTTPTDDPVKDPENPVQTADLETRTVATTASAISSGATVASIGINAIGVANLIKNGDTFNLIDRITGASQNFTASADVGASDTTISVSSVAATADFSESSIITYSQRQLIPKLEFSSNLIFGGAKVTNTDLTIATFFTTTSTVQEYTITATATTAATQDVDITLPTPAAAYERKKIIIVVRDGSASFAVNITCTGTDEIIDGGSATTTLTPGDWTTNIFRCIQDKTDDSYYWLKD